MKSKRRGFTLIELLAVIVILAIIALIAVPVIMNIISSARKSAFEDTAYGLISSGEMYYAQALLNEGMSGDTEFTIENGEFVGENKLEVKGSLPGSGKIKVSKDGKVALAITNGSICIKKGYDDSDIETLEEYESCDLPTGAPAVKTLKDLARTNTFAASVDACATSGICQPGTPFAIEVAPGDIKNFYVISDVNNEVTLIMDRNIGDRVAWINQSDYNDDDDWSVCYDEGTEDEWCTEGNNNKGPITALNHLESKTAGWTNIEAKNYTLTDDNTMPMYTIERTNARARMLTETEANAISSYDWSYGNLGDNGGFNGYWTSSAYADYADGAWFVDTDGGVTIDVVSGDDNYGVRPVISISK